MKTARATQSFISNLRVQSTIGILTLILCVSGPIYGSEGVTPQWRVNSIGVESPIKVAGFFDSIFGNSARSENSKGNDARNAGKYQEARDHYRKAIEADPNYARAQYNLGHMLFILGKNEEALMHLNHAVRLHENGAGYTTRGVLRLALGDIKGALRDQELAAKFAPPEWHVVPFNHACAKMFDGDLAGASESFAKAKLLINPNLELSISQIASQMRERVEAAVKNRKGSISDSLTSRQMQAVPCGVEIN